MFLFSDINNLIFFLSSKKHELLEMRVLCFSSRKTRINTFVKLSNNNLRYLTALYTDFIILFRQLKQFFKSESDSPAQKLQGKKTNRFYYARSQNRPILS